MEKYGPIPRKSACDEVARKHWSTRQQHIQAKYPAKTKVMKEVSLGLTQRR